MLLNMLRLGVALGDAIEMMGECAGLPGKVAPELCGCALPEPAFRPQSCLEARCWVAASLSGIFMPLLAPVLSPTFVFSMKGTFEEAPAVNGIPRMFLFWQLQMCLSLTE